MGSFDNAQSLKINNKYVRKITDSDSGVLFEANTADVNRKFAKDVSGGGTQQLVREDAAAIKSVYGTTVTWNQFVPIQPASRSTPGLAVSYLSDGIKVVGTATSVGHFYFTGAPNVATVTGHTFFRSAYAEGTISGNWYFSDANSSNSVNVNTPEKIYTQTATTNKYPLFVIPKDSVVDATFRLNMIDLTLMFGAGNEPATVAEFRKMFPNDYYAYSEPTLLSFAGNGIKSYDSSKNVVGSCTIPTATYFPDGMKSALRVYDELLPNKAIKRVGAVDMGALNWEKHASRENQYIVRNFNLPHYPDSSNVFSGTVKSDLKCIGYDATYPARIYDGSAADNTMCILIYNGTKYLRLKSGSYSTAEELKAALAGIYLYFELAEPVETAINPPLDLSYIVERGGTEEVESTELSSPIDANVEYVIT